MQGLFDALLARVNAKLQRSGRTIFTLYGYNIL